MLESFAFLSAGIASLSVCILLKLTQRWHGRYSVDELTGIQKVHKAPVLRICGFGLLGGYVAGGFVLPQSAIRIWMDIGISALPAFFAGLLEDITKSVRVRWRLVATIASALLFTSLTGYRIMQVEIPFIDPLLSYWLPSTLLTVVAIAGVSNAMNMIDGVNGLASGTAAITLLALAFLFWKGGDPVMTGICLVSAGALVGFFLLNFPFGCVFLGDAGAYMAGFVVATLVIALPIRLPQYSPLVGLVVLAYPVTEALFTIYRRSVRVGGNPYLPDRLHLHSLVYRDVARRQARLMGMPHLQNAFAGLIMLAFPLASAVLAVICAESTLMTVIALFLMGRTYLAVYKRVALLRKPQKLAVTRQSA